MVGRAPTTWTIFQQDGPNQLGLWHNIAGAAVVEPAGIFQLHGNMPQAERVRAFRGFAAAEVSSPR